jgi:DNA-binding PadR family transcriptional regulator
MHPYEMQTLIRLWHKDEFLRLKRGSLYHAIEQLRGQGCIDVLEVTRDGRRPERTVYCITGTGERQMHEWLQDMLARPRREPTQFFAALSFLPHLTPEDVQAQLQERSNLLREEIAGLDVVLKTMVPKIGRLVLVEVEYLLAMRRAEQAWVEAFRQELQSGSLHWDPQMLLRYGACIPQPEES